MSQVDAFANPCAWCATPTTLPDLCADCRRDLEGEQCANEDASTMDYYYHGGVEPVGKADGVAAFRATYAERRTQATENFKRMTGK